MQDCFKFFNLVNVDLGTLILKCKILYTISEIALIILKLEVCKSFTFKKSGAVAIRLIKLPYFSTLSMFIYCGKQLMAFLLDARLYMRIGCSRSSTFVQMR